VMRLALGVGPGAAHRKCVAQALMPVAIVGIRWRIGLGHQHGRRWVAHRPCGMIEPVANAFTAIPWPLWACRRLASRWRRRYRWLVSRMLREPAGWEKVPKVCSAMAGVEGSLQAASGAPALQPTLPAAIRSRMMAPCKSA